MLIDPQSVLNMAQALEPGTDATLNHATQIADVGFDASHAGQDYQAEGQKLATGVENIVGMLQSWSQASGATVDAMRQAVTAIQAQEQQNTDGLGTGSA
ncbi:hypothetical protein [Nocardia blacklockiae]|uniref:hypothetical protein n=1 Tax=Nocardia blacklockiae TaxID=480036 RepID=UPI001895B91F|nr:hypothetical protein [Nocardia blacklockiae]MBF6172617.1 hypothetical protein [Nocardia blacklockiae]